MSKLRLTLSCWNYDRVRALADAQHRFDDETQERRQLRRRAHDLAADDALERGPNLLRARSTVDLAFMLHHGAATFTQP